MSGAVEPEGAKRRTTRRAFALGALSSVVAGSWPRGASAQGAVFAGVPVDRLLSGRIVSASVRLPTGVPAGRAVGLVDAPLGELLRLLVDFPAYGTMFPLQSVRVDQRSHGHARLVTTGRARGIGTFRAELDVDVRGSTDGTHVFELVGRSATFEVLAARIEAKRSPGGVRSMICVDLGVGFAGVRPARLTRPAAGVSTATIARVRAALRTRRSSSGVTP